MVVSWQDKRWLASSLYGRLYALIALLALRALFLPWPAWAPTISCNIVIGGREERRAFRIDKNKTTRKTGICGFTVVLGFPKDNLAYVLIAVVSLIKTRTTTEMTTGLC